VNGFTHILFYTNYFCNTLRVNTDFEVNVIKIMQMTSHASDYVDGRLKLESLRIVI